MRTQQEIINRIKNDCQSLFGFDKDVLLSYLEFDFAKPFLKEGVTREEWKEIQKSNDPETIKIEMFEYLAFAWDKALGHRGLSAGRSVEKLTEWLWLLNDEELVLFAENQHNYPNYGAPILRKISEKYNFPMPTSSAADRMSQGLSCQEGCEEGCGQ